MVTLAGLIITLLSWLVYDERLTVGQFIGIGAVLVAVVMMGFF